VRWLPSLTKQQYLIFIGPCIANIFAQYNKQDATFHNLFISVRHTTCFRRVFRPSSGAQHCTYSDRYWSYKYLTLYAYFWAPNDGRKNRLTHVERLTEINKFWNVASYWLYSAKTTWLMETGTNFNIGVLFFSKQHFSLQYNCNTLHSRCEKNSTSVLNKALIFRQILFKIKCIELSKYPRIKFNENSFSSSYRTGGQTGTKWAHLWNVSASKLTFFNYKTGTLKPLE